MKISLSLAALFVTRLFIFLTFAGVASQSASAQPSIPTNFRVDISDGNTGQLFVSWNKMDGATYYNLQWATPTSGYQAVPNCYGPGNAGYNDTRFDTEVCRHSGLAITTPPTTYSYRVAACNNSGQCSSYTPSQSNTPVSCNCDSVHMPAMVFNGQNILPPNALRFKTTTVTNDATYMPNAEEFAAYHNSSDGITARNVLLVQLPGSGSTCSYSHLMYTAQNLGFDTICVNYSNNTEQETICANDGTPDPQCFYAISQAKWDASGNCLQREVSYPHCGYDNYTQSQYFNQYPDSVVHRIITMLQYLSANDTHANWSQYLTSAGSAPKWSKIIVGGFSQGGDMATYGAGYLASINSPMLRAINLSAPPQAVQVNGPWVAATYLGGPPPWLSTTTLSTVYGLVSANDSHYTRFDVNGVYQVVWTAMGFTAANNDSEWDLNCTTSMNSACTNQHQSITTMQGLNCLGTPSHNLVNFAATNPSGTGHDDTLYLWNQDMYEFMLID